MCCFSIVVKITRFIKSKIPVAIGIQMEKEKSPTSGEQSVSDLSKSNPIEVPLNLEELSTVPEASELPPLTEEEKPDSLEDKLPESEKPQQEIEYSPSITEIANETYREIINSKPVQILYHSITTAGKVTGRFLFVTLGFAAYVNAFPYIVPYTLREENKLFSKFKSRNKNNNKAKSLEEGIASVSNQESVVDKESVKNENDKPYEKKLIPNTIMVSGGVASIIGLGFQAYGYMYAVKNDHPELLLVPITTNIISGIYEKAKSVKEKLIIQHYQKIDAENNPDINLQNNTVLQ